MHAFESITSDSNTLSCVLTHTVGIYCEAWLFAAEIRSRKLAYRTCALYLNLIDGSFTVSLYEGSIINNLSLCLTVCMSMNFRSPLKERLSHLRRWLQDLNLSKVADMSMPPSSFIPGKSKFQRFLREHSIRRIPSASFARWRHVSCVAL